MTSVPFGATCSPFLLASVIRYHLSENAGIHPSAVKLPKRIWSPIFVMIKVIYVMLNFMTNIEIRI